MAVMLSDDRCGEDEQEAVSRSPLWTREGADEHFPSEADEFDYNGDFAVELRMR